MTTVQFDLLMKTDTTAGILAVCEVVWLTSFLQQTNNAERFSCWVSQDHMSHSKRSVAYQTIQYQPHALLRCHHTQLVIHLS